jgi:hypothetical protein
MRSGGDVGLFQYLCAGCKLNAAQFSRMIPGL